MATPVFCCGFECGIVHTSNPHWTLLLGTGSYDTATIRNGARSWRANPTAGVSDLTSRSLGSSNTWALRFYVRFDVLPDVDTMLCFVEGSFGGVAFKASDSKIYAGALPVSTVLFGATGVAVTTDVWYRIDLKVDASANPHLVDVSVDGTAAAQYSRAAAAAAGSTIRIGSIKSSTADIYFEDFLISHTLGDFPLGAGDVQSYVPNADGSHNVAGSGDFRFGVLGAGILNSTTTAYTVIDDRPLESSVVSENFINCLAPPNNTDYVECAFENSAEAIAPRAVDVILAHHQAGTGVADSQFRLRDTNGGTEDTIVALNAAGVTTLRYASKQYAAIPGGGAWTLTAFNALVVRFGYSSDTNPDQYFDGIMIEAEYSGSQPQSPALPVAAVAVSGVTPAVTLGALSVALPVAAVAVAGVAPAVAATLSLALPVATVAVAGVEPDVTEGAVSVALPVAAVATAGVAPVLSGVAASVDLSVAAVAVSGVTPAVTSVLSLALPVASIAVAGVAPDVTLGALALALTVAAVLIPGVAPAVSVGAASAGLTVAVVTLSGVAPTVTLGAISLALTVAGVVVSGIEPTVTVGAISVALSVVAVTIAGVEPAVSLGALSIALPVAVVTLTGIEPTLTGGASVDLPVAAVALAGVAPTITVGAINVALTVAVVVVSGSPPQISSGGQFADIPVAAIAIAGIAPTVTEGALSVALSVAAVATSGVAPDVALGALSLALPVAVVSVTGSTPQIEATLSLALPVAVVVVTGVAPGVTQSGGPQNVALTVAVVLVAGVAPSVAPAALSLALPVAAVAVSGITPAVSGAILVALPVAGIATSAIAPSVTIGAALVALPAALSPVVGVAPSVVGGAISVALPVAVIVITAPVLVRLEPTTSVLRLLASFTPRIVAPASYEPTVALDAAYILTPILLEASNR